MKRPGWTLLVQGVDGHDLQVHQLLQQFRFVPDARLDDLMISLASTGGGVGPHFDSYDVFLLQASGRRRWKISQQKDLTLQPDMPLKILQNFEPDEEFVLDAGDMLYLPPRYAHDGTAEAMLGVDGKNVDCMTYSIGFKAPSQADLAASLLHKLAEFSEDEHADLPADRSPIMYRDRSQSATAAPAQLPEALVNFASAALTKALTRPQAVACAVGELMTAPKARVWFDEPAAPLGTKAGQALVLDTQTRMMYVDHHVFINGESYRAAGSDAKLMRALADNRRLGTQQVTKASAGAFNLLADWHAAGWLHLEEPG